MNANIFSSADVDMLKNLGYMVDGATYNLLNTTDVKVHSMILPWNKSDDMPFYVKVKKTKSGFSFVKTTLAKIDGKVILGFSNKISGTAKTISGFLKKTS